MRKTNFPKACFRFGEGLISEVMQLQQVFISELFWYPAASLGGESLSFWGSDSTQKIKVCFLLGTITYYPP